MEVQSLYLYIEYWSKKCAKNMEIVNMRVLPKNIIYVIYILGSYLEQDIVAKYGFRELKPVPRI
jgi:hypothetical protein